MAGPVFAAAGGSAVDGFADFRHRAHGSVRFHGGDRSVGALFDMSDRMRTSVKDMKLGIRADMAYFDWDGSAYGIDVCVPAG